MNDVPKLWSVETYKFPPPSLVVPAVCNIAVGVEIPIPTLPSAVNLTRSTEPIVTANPFDTPVL